MVLETAVNGQAQAIEGKYAYVYLDGIVLNYP